MENIYRYNQHGKRDYGWLKPTYHFSFSEYYNKDRMHLGTLRVLNDDLVLGNSGFDTHPHNDMEIITYIIDGELTHKDSMGNERTLSRGNVQYMSAGTGVFHSEYNNSDETLRLLQIWIYPNIKGAKPNYGDALFTKEDRLNTVFHIVSSHDGEGKIKIHQDANIFVSEFDKEEEFVFDKGELKYIYFVNIEGTTFVNGNKLEKGDSFETDNNLSIKTTKGSHFMILQINDL